MTAILDTSFLFALTDQSDRNHQRVLMFAQNANEKLVLPVVVLPEICVKVHIPPCYQAEKFQVF